MRTGKKEKVECHGKLGSETLNGASVHSNDTESTRVEWRSCYRVKSEEQLHFFVFQVGCDGKLMLTDEMSEDIDVDSFCHFGCYHVAPTASKSTPRHSSTSKSSPRE